MSSIDLEMNELNSEKTNSPKKEPTLYKIWFIKMVKILSSRQK